MDVSVALNPTVNYKRSGSYEKRPTKYVRADFPVRVSLQVHTPPRSHFSPEKTARLAVLLTALSSKVQERFPGSSWGPLLAITDQKVHEG